MVDHQVDLEVELAQDQVAKEEVEEEEDLLVDQERVVKVELEDQGRTSTSRTASKASRSRTGRSRSQCDIRTKIDISPLINSNLVKDNLAEVAYFVQEIRN